MICPSCASAQFTKSGADHGLPIGWKRSTYKAIGPYGALAVTRWDDESATINATLSLAGMQWACNPAREADPAETHISAWLEPLVFLRSSSDGMRAVSVGFVADPRAAVLRLRVEAGDGGWCAQVWPLALYDNRFSRHETDACYDLALGFVTRRLALFRWGVRLARGVGNQPMSPAGRELDLGGFLFHAAWVSGRSGIEWTMLGTSPTVGLIHYRNNETAVSFNAFWPLIRYHRLHGDRRHRFRFSVVYIYSDGGSIEYGLSGALKVVQRTETFDDGLVASSRTAVTVAQALRVDYAWRVGEAPTLASHLYLPWCVHPRLALASLVVRPGVETSAAIQPLFSASRKARGGAGPGAAVTTLAGGWLWSPELAVMYARWGDGRGGLDSKWRLGSLVQSTSKDGGRSRWTSVLAPLVRWWSKDNGADTGFTAWPLATARLTGGETGVAERGGPGTDAGGSIEVTAFWYVPLLFVCARVVF